MLEIDLAPSQGAKLTCSEAMSVRQQDRRCIPSAIAPSLACCLDQAIYFLLGQILSHSVGRVGQSPQCSVYCGRGSNRGPVPPEVPKAIADDYVEACRVLPTSAKASAALSRRCLQTMLHAHGYKDRDLAKEIQQLLNANVLPQHIQETVDAIRNFGNFSAHPINDKTSLQVIDVDPEEAEWCLEILEALFDHFYVGPEKAKARKAALNKKLAAAGKPPSK